MGTVSRCGGPVRRARELVAGARRCRRRSRVSGGVAGALTGQLGERTLDLAPDPADRDAEDALAALDQVDDLVGGGALVDAGAVAHQRDLGQVLDAALAQVADGGADVLQRDPGVQQPLDHLEHQDVAEAVEPLGARSVGRADARLDQAGAGPVVELAVGDAGGGAGRRPAVAHVLGQDRQVVVEQQPLLAGALVEPPRAQPVVDRRRCRSVGCRRCWSRGPPSRTPRGKVRASPHEQISGSHGWSYSEGVQVTDGTHAPTPGPVNDAPGASGLGVSESRPQVEGQPWSAAVSPWAGRLVAAEVLRRDLVEELAELLDLVLLLVRDLMPASSRTSSAPKIGAPVRRARAMASDGRALTSTPPAKTSSA